MVSARLASFYLFYFAVLGAMVPYWGPYLRSIGFSAAQIGELMAILLGTKLVAPYLWGWIADRSGRRMRIIRLAGFLAAALFAGFLLGDSYLWMAAVMMSFSFFWNAALPQFEAVTLNHLGKRVDRYGRIRLWGSVGFIASVVTIGPVLDARGEAILPWIVWGLLLLLWFSTLTVPDRGDRRQVSARGSITGILRRPEVVSLFIACFLAKASHGPYYGFFTIHLQDVGYSGGVIGALWALGVVAEIGVFLLMPRLLPWAGPRLLMLIALGLTAIRWLLIAGFVDKIGVLVGAQLLHMASFGLYHAVAVHFIHRFFAGPYQGRGQALYSSLSFGAGGALGSLAGGYLWDGLGAAQVFALAGAAAAVAFVVAWFGLPRRDPVQTQVPAEQPRELTSNQE
ncbi:PPP family 3-phenylpropionic acid transporter [Natronospira proteinivora]|uniref:PPP family 3-phenylpropionic acid transporter n=1 Tax=Natronospira proteinivora TaxID=1807133 RepID=A0ABT1G7T0_9GAMM|nr:MFS transporter [Natronospira proteinivora]MCP1727107.1 PPP family 3-phenylpropionic acid transporter [Natronospira proteinivora]